jgi:hypothetical protein
LNVHANRNSVSSSSTSHNPRITRNRESAARDCTFCPYRYAAVPARKTNAGAQKWVTQRVKNTAGSGPPAGTPA